MAQSSAFAFKNSGLGTFLYAEVGTELNGSDLTIFSILARLGQDPWAEAARWVKLPKATVIDYLTQSIAQMPLCPQALNDARLTAARLILLLPAQTTAPAGGTTRVAPWPLSLRAMPRWLPVALAGGVLAFGLVVNLMTTRVSAPAMLAPTQQAADGPVFK